MLSEDKYFQTLTEDKLWQRYCGFLDLSVDEFMNIQRELLMDEIERIADSTLGRKIMGDQKPGSVAEFRRIVPLTSYEDYEPYLSEKQEDALAEKPQMWCHSSGRGGRFKWIPLSMGFLEKLTKASLCSCILASANRKGEVNISSGARFFFMLAPPPYASGCFMQNLTRCFSFQAIPDSEKNKDIQFQDRVQKGFNEALKEGVDIIGSLASVLVKMGEQFAEGKSKRKLSPSMLHPQIVFHMLRAKLRARKEGRKMLPRDLWPTKAIMTGGTDTSIYRSDIARYWGRKPFEFYICAEAFHLAMQGWNKRDMVFLPDMAFLEFIPQEELLKRESDKSYQPSTVLLNELEVGKLYEIVITQLYGGPLLRYPMKDLIKVTALRDDETGVNLPQMVFQRRVDEVINLAALAQLDEKTIWQAIANTGVKYTDWSACKEYDRNQAFLRIYLELKEERKADDLAALIDEQLKLVDTDYKDIDAYLKLQPVRVTLLSSSTFQLYTEEKRKEGADPAHLKPNHINAPQAVIESLLRLSEVSGEK
ncbi:MAG: GH3 auxin-responsive promoter family protein [Dehalococcoidales bacterium]|nr:GH3 auxin-responsive promoter family protein [Dehalococcoidales bacterium]